LDTRENSYPTLEPKTARSLAERISVYSPATALGRIEDNLRKWYYWQPGVLFPYQIWDMASPVSYGGLTRNQALFVLVPTDLVHARRRAYLHHCARRMGIREQARMDAYCEEAIREIIEDPSPRSHPAFEADALARQVASWLEFLAYRAIPQTADWRW
jgi:hypothetical protein